MLNLIDKLDYKFLSGSRRNLAKACLKIINSSEFRSSKLIIENSINHNNESVYNHSLKIFKNFQKTLNFNFIKSRRCRQKAEDYFSQKIGKWKRAELFLIASLLHDLGKVKNLVGSKNGITRPIEHELISASLARKILKRFKYGNDEIIYVLNIVKLHSGYTFSFLNLLSELSKNQLQDALGSIMLLPEIFLFMLVENRNAFVFFKYKRLIKEKLLQESIIYKVNSSLKSNRKNGELIKEVLLNTKIISKPWPIDVRLLHLSEEVGELHDIYLQYIGAKDRIQTISDIQNALNDVLQEILILYDIFGLDIESSLKKILEKDGE